MATRTCRICGRADPAWPWVNQGRCPMCHMYWKRHGVERPPQPPRPRVGGWPPATLRPCTRCGQLTRTPTRGLCLRCYSSWLRTRRARPRAPQPRAALPPRLCSHCGQPTTRPRRGRCEPCYRYWREHGVEHLVTPSRAAPSLQPCQTCGHPVREFQRGRCNACYKYWRRHGVERPAHLWQR
jgi:hypothetical protein